MTTTIALIRRARRPLLAGLIALLSACGGGDAVVNNTSQVPTATTTLEGTAATGAAIVGGVVLVKCASGNATSPITGSDGSFKVDLSNAVLPCLVKVSYKDASGAAQELHSLASTTGTLNVTPLTEMIVAAASGGAPSALFNAGASSLQAVIQKIPQAIATIKARLDSLGVDTTNLSKNPLNDGFKPAVGNATGDPADKVLDDLKTKLAGQGKTLKAISDEVAIGQTSNAPVTTTSTTTSSTSAGTSTATTTETSSTTPSTTTTTPSTTSTTATTPSTTSTTTTTPPTTSTTTTTPSVTPTVSTTVTTTTGLPASTTGVGHTGNNQYAKCLGDISSNKTMAGIELNWPTVLGAAYYQISGNHADAFLSGGRPLEAGSTNFFGITRTTTSFVDTGTLTSGITITYGVTAFDPNKVVVCSLNAASATLAIGPATSKVTTQLTGAVSAIGVFAGPGTSAQLGNVSLFLGGNADKVMTTSDGATYSVTNAPIAGSTTFYSRVAATANKFVMAATDFGGTKVQIANSVSGSAWTTTTQIVLPSTAKSPYAVSVSFINYIDSVLYLTVAFVPAADNAVKHVALYKSLDDGVTWTLLNANIATTSNTTGGPLSLVGKPNLLVMSYSGVTTSNKYFSSTDGGTTWSSPVSSLPGTTTNTSYPNPRVYGFTTSGKWLATQDDVGTSGVQWTSTDGQSWTIASSPARYISGAAVNYRFCGSVNRPDVNTYSARSYFVCADPDNANGTAIVSTSDGDAWRYEGRHLGGTFTANSMLVRPDGKILLVNGATNASLLSFTVLP
jgi:hypothetical protein